jgi:hypothetical protein
MFICSAGYYHSDKHIHFMLDSAKRLGIDVHVYGMRKKWPGFFGAKIIQLKKELENTDEDISLYVDGSDTLFVRPVVEIKRCFMEVGTTILLAGERMCFPHPQVKPFFVGRAKGLFKFPGAGCIIGYTEELISALKTIIANRKKYISEYKIDGENKEDDQGFWQLAAVEGDVEFSVDWDQQVVTSVANTRKAWYTACKNNFILRRGGPGGKCQRASPIVHLGGCLGRSLRRWALERIKGRDGGK